MEELCIGRQKSSFQSFVAPGSIPRINLNNVNNDENEKHVDVDEEDEDDGRNDMFNKTAGGFISSLNSPFDQAIGNTSDAVSSCSLLNLNNNTTCFTSIKNKRVSEDHNIFNAESGVNRRHKRMMKNRESAARSRARRQAYTSELEREHAKLKEENAKLRKLQQRLVVVITVFGICSG
ncbi:protein FD isoform X2 [Spinacia oleracea]|uniref:Protein FD isoform X2 n=1 Tax=Spinacia oleracea TaxID=3562 RepID=A0A9R0JFI4_SPIOL|nr:protein FD-like isoform X2 [Spinacia oleracea]